MQEQSQKQGPRTSRYSLDRCYGGLKSVHVVASFAYITIHDRRYYFIATAIGGRALPTMLQLCLLPSPGCGSLFRLE